MRNFSPCSINSTVTYLRIFFFTVTLSFSVFVSAQPVISSFSPVSGPIGTTVTITGSNFSSVPLNNIVYLGAMRANVTASTASSVTITVPAGATERPLSVTVNGLIGYSSRPFILTFPDGSAISQGPDMIQNCFAPKIDSSTDLHPNSVVIMDFDGDGKPDIATPNNYSTTGQPASVSVMRNTGMAGSFSFEHRQDLFTGVLTNSLAAGDLDGDGKPDMVSSSVVDHTISVFRNTSVVNTISFAPKADISTGNSPVSVAIADIDKDGRPDIVVSTFSIASLNTISVFRNTSSAGNISFAPRVDYEISSLLGPMSTGDLDGDGKVDVAVSNEFLNSVSVLRNTSTPGTISFAAKIDFTTGNAPKGIATGDLDGDGKAEIVVANYNAPFSFSVLRNTGSPGTISFAAKVDFPCGANPLSVSIGDINGDAKPDIVIPSANLGVCQNNSIPGNISFGTIVYTFLSPVANYAAIGDLTGDGKADLAASLFSSSAVSFLRNKNNEPTVRFFSPATAGTGSTVTITGYNFGNASAVNFGGVPATSFSIVNPTTIEAIVGTGVSGAVSVSNQYGEGKQDGFIFAGPPIITSFTPTAASANTYVTITGVNFSNVTEVSFGGFPTTNFTIESPTTIRAEVQVAASGNVSVKNPYGTASLPGFVVIPGISSFSPNTGGTGATVTINGSNLNSVTGVNFGGTPASSFAIVNNTTITAVVGNGSSGNITLISAGGNVSMPGFTYIPPPVISSFNPTSGGFETIVTITGTNFTGATAVSFGGVPANSFTVVNSTTINAMVAFGSASGNVSVTTPGGTATLPGFTFVPPPSIDAFIPGSAGTGTTVTITGTNLSTTTAVTFGGTTASSFVAVNNGTLNAVVGLGTTGNIRVVTLGGATERAGFIYILPPSISSFTPASAGTGLTVTITGSNFSNASAVSFGGIAATSFSVVNSTTITAVVGAGASGNVTVTTPGGVTSLAGFTYVPTPVVTSFSPASAGTGTTVTITGSNLSAATAVYFGDAIAASITNVSSTSVTAIVGGGSSGSVSVTTAGGTGALPGFTFTSPPAPVITSFTPASGAVGTSVTINGNNFNSTAANNIVQFGATNALVTASTATQLTVTVPNGATYFPFNVLNTGTNLIGHSFLPFGTTFPGGAGPFTSNSFSPRQDITVPSLESVFDVVIVDLDKDGKPDAAFTDHSGNGGTTVSILRNTGTNEIIAFAPRTTYVVGSLPRCVNYGDLDNDGKPDLVTANIGAIPGSISILRNTSTPGNISFGNAINYVVNGAPENTVIQDLDGDGRLDIAVVNVGAQVLTVLRNTSVPGSISFGTRTEYTVNINCYGITAGDIDGDGKPDLAILNSSDNVMSVFRNTSTIGAITFAPKVDFAVAASPYRIEQGDIDGDSKPDMVISSLGNHVICVFRNTSTAGTISFAARQDFATGAFPGGIAFSDLDGDGKVDLAVAQTGPNNMGVFKNTSSLGNISLAARVDYRTANTPFNIAVGDLNSDGKPDILVSCSNSLTILRNQVNGPAISSFSPASGATGTTITITGTNLSGATAVSFGGIAANSFVAVNNTTITAIVANGASGDVRVTTPLGITILPGFTYIAPPVITGFTPANGTNGTTVTITGTNFTGATAVSFGGVPATSYVVNSSASITAVVGAGASGSVSVTTPGGTASLAWFTYDFPTSVGDPLNNNSKDLVAYPNPADDVLLIKHPANIRNTKIRILDITGREIKQIVPVRNSGQTQTGIKEFAAGIYQIIWSDGIKTLTRTLMIK
ncbi:MAG: IPT/TIG domain-containing protein [Chitinophagaceae bacterium]|nr:IPT/TIG domain-containing protein [Chitinophagaceae bacterium]